uniref:Uncharacterized protein n=1 Tax=Trichogramma kaykai TaxID=54128 RepID=A0ABD2WV86_9HYME
MADDEGSTPLHLISQLKKGDDSMKLFFETVDEVGRATVQVDAVDMLGRTPLQLAEANFSPNQVGLILDRGADLSNLVFPSESSIEARFKWPYVSKVEFLLDKLNLSSGCVDQPNIRKRTNWWWFTKSNKAKACIAHLREKILRRFFQRWTVNPFWELIRHRLPILCCDMIIEELTNQDLYNICLAADRQNDGKDK